MTDHPNRSAESAEALRLLAAEDARQDKLQEILETIREQIRLEVAPEHRPDGLFKNIQDAVYAMRGRTRLMGDAAITHVLNAAQAVGKCPECGWNGGGVRDEGCMISPCPRMPPAATVESVAEDAMQRWYADPRVKEALHWKPLERSSAGSAKLTVAAQIEHIMRANRLEGIPEISRKIAAALVLNEPQTSLESLLREYARDLRRNSSGGDDYDYERGAAEADYLETLIARSKSSSQVSRPQSRSGE